MRGQGEGRGAGGEGEGRRLLGGACAPIACKCSTQRPIACECSARCCRLPRIHAFIVFYRILYVFQCILRNVRDTTRIRRIRCISMYPGRNTGAPPGYGQDTQDTRILRNTHRIHQDTSEYNFIENPTKFHRKAHPTRGCDWRQRGYGGWPP